MGFREVVWGHGLDLCGSGQVHVAGCCECGIEPLGSIKFREFFGQLRTCQFLRKDSAPRSQCSNLICSSFLLKCKSDLLVTNQDEMVLKGRSAAIRYKYVCILLCTHFISLVLYENNALCSDSCDQHLSDPGLPFLLPGSSLYRHPLLTALITMQKSCCSLFGM